MESDPRARRRRWPPSSAWATRSIRGPADLLVNATSVGLDAGHCRRTRRSQRSGFAASTPPETVVDLVYGDEPTPLVAWASRGGGHVVGGLEVLVRQGALSLELWTGRDGAGRRHAPRGPVARASSSVHFASKPPRGALPICGAMAISRPVLLVLLGRPPLGATAFAVQNARDASDDSSATVSARPSRSQPAARALSNADQAVGRGLLRQRRARQREDRRAASSFKQAGGDEQSTSA